MMFLICVVNMAHFEIWNGTLASVYNFGPRWDFKLFSKRKLSRYHIFSDYRIAWNSNTIFSRNFLEDVYSFKQYKLSRPVFLASKCRDPSSRKALLSALFHTKSFRDYCPHCLIKTETYVHHQIFECNQLHTNRTQFLSTLDPESRALFTKNDFPILLQSLDDFENLAKYLQCVTY